MGCNSTIFQYWCTDSRMVIRDPLCYGTAEF